VVVTPDDAEVVILPCGPEPVSTDMVTLAVFDMSETTSAAKGEPTSTVHMAVMGGATAGTGIKTMSAVSRLTATTARSDERGAMSGTSFGRGPLLMVNQRTTEEGSLFQVQSVCSQSGLGQPTPSVVHVELPLCAMYGIQDHDPADWQHCGNSTFARGRCGGGVGGMGPSQTAVPGCGGAPGGGAGG